MPPVVLEVVVNLMGNADREIDYRNDRNKRRFNLTLADAPIN
jgi:hypothetical protein